jgi:DivIVA domain-containing protein
MDQREHLEQETVEFVDPSLKPSVQAAAAAPHQVAGDPGLQVAVELAPPERFPIVWRGYDRDSVDALLAELEVELEQLRVRHEPRAAVKHEIDRIGAATADILRVAHERAERITSRAREEANARVDLAHAEAKQITADAEKRMRQLDADADVVWQERRRLIEDTKRLADQLLAVADDAAERFPEEEPGAREAQGSQAASAETVPVRPVSAAEPETG